ncbi:MAG: DUF4286 domain-containing protein [Planctomycetota bacterium]
MLAYTVIATARDRAAADEFIGWLAHPDGSGHARDVVDAGASSAEVVRLDTEPSGEVRVEVRYLFVDRAAFDAYAAGPATALREEGLKKFPPGSPITLARTVGERVARIGGGPSG